jgi:hypothetical protein
MKTMKKIRTAGVILAAELDHTRALPAFTRSRRTWYGRGNHPLSRSHSGLQQFVRPHHLSTWIPSAYWFSPADFEDSATFISQAQEKPPSMSPV